MSNVFTRKVISIATSLLLISSMTFFLPTSHAVDKASPSVKCRATKAVPHQPLLTNPPQKVAAKLPKKLTLTTNCGTIEIALDAMAPFTVTQMAALVRAKYFDKSLCHRLAVRGFYMLQCGDPTASGGGNPGFEYSDENLPFTAKSRYPAGTVAMANSGPNTNGSQFFMVFQDSGVLDPNYSVWGKITKGIEILRYIGDLGVENPKGIGEPRIKFAIERARVS
jgi:peptidyl-prolyl cis-trans isomerase B (cyclophilin B)